MKKLFISMILMTGLILTGCSSNKEAVQEQEETTVVYCSDCGEESNEVTKYCSECGVEAKWVSEKEETEEEDEESVNEEEVIVEEDTVVKDEVYVEKPKFTESKALEIFINHYGPAEDGYLYVPKGMSVENGKTYCLIVVGLPDSGGWSYKVFEDGVIVENIVIEDGEEIGL